MEVSQARARFLLEAAHFEIQDGGRNGQDFEPGPHLAQALIPLADDGRDRGRLDPAGQRRDQPIDLPSQALCLGL